MFWTPADVFLAAIVKIFRTVNAVFHVFDLHKCCSEGCDVVSVFQLYCFYYYDHECEFCEDLHCCESLSMPPLVTTRRLRFLSQMFNALMDMSFYTNTNTVELNKQDE